MYAEITRQYEMDNSVYREELSAMYNTAGNFLPMVLEALQDDERMICCTVSVFETNGGLIRQFTAWRNINGSVRGKILFYTPEDAPTDAHRIFDGINLDDEHGEGTLIL